MSREEASPHLPDPESCESSHPHGERRRYRSVQLFGDCPCITIEHGGQEYQLRITRLGKLILTK